MRPYSGQIEMKLGIAEFERLLALANAAADRRNAARNEYYRKAAVPIVGLWYSWLAWRRYVAAMKASQEAFASFFAFSTIHLARLQGMECFPKKEMMQ